MHDKPHGGWLVRAGKWRVEHVPCPGPTGPLHDRGLPLGVLHTTQGSTIEGALSVFRRANRPKFTVGRDAKRRVRVLQHSPLGVPDAALKHTRAPETNRRVRAQIEIVGFSIFNRLWHPDGEVEDALTSLMVELNERAGIPFHHVPVRRNEHRWAGATGWLGHVDVPENDHIDAGRFDYQRAFRICRDKKHSGIPPRAKPRRKLLHPIQGARVVALERRAAKAEPSSLCPTREDG